MNTEMMELFAEHTSKDYPVGVYYIDLEKMYMNSVRSHWHSELEIDYVKSGSAVFSIGEESIPLSSGNVILINGNRIHSIHSANDENCVILSLLFHPAYLFDSERSFLSVKYCAPITSNSAFRYMTFDRADDFGRKGIECINSILNANLTKSYGFELETKSLLCSFWLQLLAKSALSEKPSNAATLATMDEERIKDAIQYIHSNYASPLTLDDIAESIHVSKSECCRCFKRTLHITPFDYLLKHRIFESARRMQKGDQSADSITALATSVGFHNASYYNKIFRKYLNRTPTEYREQIKKSHRDALSPFGISLARM